MFRKYLQIFSHIRRPTLSFMFSSQHDKLHQILSKIKVQSEDGKNQSLLDSGMITGHNIDASNKVKITLNLTKDYRRIKAMLKTQLQGQGFKDIDIVLAPKVKQQTFNRKGNLLGIKKIIAVSSCKGGVGKSTIAVNIAATLQNQGHRVGIFDSDIYGPSLPTLINMQNQILQPMQDNAKEIKPIQYQGLKCMSFGFAGQKPAIMRGPIVSSLISQLLYQTHWGQLDYLIVDMPPGTGDIQLSLCQQLNFDGAVIVTTPQRLSFIDVIKGMEMFTDLRVRILGIVENMAYYQCGNCGHKDLIFGRGYTQLMMTQFGIQNTFQIPLLSLISKYSDNGTPLAFVLPPEHTLNKIYRDISTSIVKQVQQDLQKVFVYYNTTDRAIIVEQNNVKKKISPFELRSQCKCALCVDQLSGALLLKKQEIDPQVYPTKIEPKGNYAVAVIWSDGHKSSIYPYKRLLSADIQGM